MASSSNDTNKYNQGNDGPSSCKRSRLSSEMEWMDSENAVNDVKMGETCLVFAVSSSTQNTQEYALDVAEVSSNRSGAQANAGTSEINSNHPDHSLRKTPSIARDAQIIASVVPNANYNVIYNKLLQNRDNKERLNLVTSNILESNGNESKKDNSPLYNKKLPTIIEDVDNIMKQFPNADADLVYGFLESLKNEPDRVQKTIKEMGLRKEETISLIKEVNPTLIKKSSTFSDDPALANDTLFKDMRAVAKMFPDHDRNEIYALLEANVGKHNRVQIVINEVLQNGPKNQTDHNNIPTETITVDSSSDDQTPAVIDLTVLGALQEDVEHLLLLVPDCDPNYLYEKLEEMKDNKDRRMILAGKLTDNKDYPKLKDSLEKWKPREECKRSFSIEEFLKIFPNPKDTFSDHTKPVSQAYLENARVCLLNDFSMMKTNYLRDMLKRCNNHFYSAYNRISEHLVQIPIVERKFHHRFLKSKRKVTEPEPKEMDQYFYHEYWFTHNELKIEDYVKEKELERQLKVQSAKDNGELYECTCCFEDECLFEDLASCPEGHLFCKDCVSRSTKAAFGEMKIRFPCLTGTCDQAFTLSTLQEIISANLFSKIVSRMQEEEVLQADIPDLVTCPFCPFATVMPNQDDKVLKCLNPECLKESCRLCQEENHIPLKCNEVESKAGTKMRTYIENKMAEAVMRKCHKCNKKFLKDSGCNMMTCVCGANSCYNCKEKDIDYNHFNGNKKCGQTDPNVIHQRDMNEAAGKAQADYLLEHPEAAELNLDLKNILENYDSTPREIYDIGDAEDDNMEDHSDSDY